MLEVRVVGRSQPAQNLSTPDKNSLQLLYVVLMVPGVFVTLLSFGVYPPVDRGLPMGMMLFAFLFPVALQMFSFIRPGKSARNWLPLYVSTSVALLLLAISLFVNGGLDRSPTEKVRTTIVRKTVLRGKQTNYDLTLSPWRQDGNVKHFSVTSSIFSRAVVGKTATIDVHHGFFGLPWYSSISPE
jgi:hypothetical protein